MSEWSEGKHCKYCGIKFFDMVKRSKDHCGECEDAIKAERLKIIALKEECGLEFEEYIEKRIENILKYK